MPDRKLELPEGVPPLNTYYFYLTGGCNLACQHCWIAPSYQANGGTGGHLDYSLFVQAVEEGIPLGLSGVKLTGGEPLLHPDFVRIMDYLQEKALGVTIETNGTLMTSELAQYLRNKTTLKFISVSLDGATPASHDLFRGVQGSFEKSCQGVRSLAEAGFSPQVIMSLHLGNIQEIEAVVRLSEQLGAGSVKFNLIQPSGRGNLMKKQGRVNEIPEYIRIGRWVENDLQKTTNLYLSFSWPMAFFGINRLLNYKGYSCNIHNILGVLSSGHLAMCGIGTQIPELCYGKIGEDSISSIWISHPLLLDLRNSIPEKLGGVCKQCIFKEKCFGYCAADNYLVTGQIAADNRFCREANVLGYFPESRKIRQGV